LQDFVSLVTSRDRHAICNQEDDQSSIAENQMDECMVTIYAFFKSPNRLGWAIPKVIEQLGKTALLDSAREVPSEQLSLDGLWTPPPWIDSGRTQTADESRPAP
jgi:hypothetical protein